MRERVFIVINYFFIFIVLNVFRFRFGKWVKIRDFLGF